MENFMSQEGRNIFKFRLLGGCNLLRSGRNLLIISLLVVCPVFLANSCRKEAVEDKEKDEEQVEEYDFKLQIDSLHESIRRLDLFIYDEEEMLEKHYPLDSVDVLMRFSCSAGPKKLIAVANCPYKFNLNAVQKYSSLVKLSFNFADDDCKYPIMGDRRELTVGADGALVSIKPMPLMSYVELSAVSCNLDNYDLLESPQVRLKWINASAALFSDSPHIASEFVNHGEWRKLEYDIGTYTQYPGIRLPAYPNESDNESANASATVLEFQCVIRGEKCSFEVSIPSIRRAAITRVELEVHAPGEHSSKVY